MIWDYLFSRPSPLAAKLGNPARVLFLQKLNCHPDEAWVSSFFLARSVAWCVSFRSVALRHLEHEFSRIGKYCSLDIQSSHRSNHPSLTALNALESSFRPLNSNSIGSQTKHRWSPCAWADASQKEKARWKSQRKSQDSQIQFVSYRVACNLPFRQTCFHTSYLHCAM